MKRLVGISINHFQELYGDEKALELAAKVGADAVDFSVGFGKINHFRTPDSVYSKGEDAILEYYSKLKERADSLGIKISQTHGKTQGFINKKLNDDDLVENTRLDCLATSALGAPACVVHNATSIFLGPNPNPELMHSLSYDFFSRTIPYAKQYGVKIATETFGDAVKYDAVDFFGDINEFEKAYRAIKAVDELKDGFTVCVDTGHSNKAMRFGNPTPGDVIRRLGSEVTTLHLNDNDTFEDQHKIPGKGIIDWNDIFDALDEVGYSGVYNMELNLYHYGKDFTVELAEFAVKVMRHMLKERYGEQ